MKSSNELLYRPLVAVCQGTANTDALADAHPEPCQWVTPGRLQVSNTASATTIATKISISTAVDLASNSSQHEENKFVGKCIKAYTLAVKSPDTRTPEAILDDEAEPVRSLYQARKGCASQQQYLMLWLYEHARWDVRTCCSTHTCMLLYTSTACDSPSTSRLLYKGWAPLLGLSSSQNPCQKSTKTSQVH